MYKILKAGKLAGNIYEMVVEAPRVAKHCLPGQFIIVKISILIAPAQDNFRTVPCSSALSSVWFLLPGRQHRHPKADP